MLFVIGWTCGVLSGFALAITFGIRGALRRAEAAVIADKANVPLVLKRHIYGEVERWCAEADSVQEVRRRCEGAYSDLGRTLGGRVGERMVD